MIGYYLHHQGEGHRRRGAAVARALRSEVVGLGSGGAPQGWRGGWVELARDDEPAVGAASVPATGGPSAADDSDVTAGGVLHWAPLHHPGLLERHRQLVDWLAEARPTLVVVDVSVEVALLVRLCGVPVVVGAMPGDRTDRAHRLAYDLAAALLAPWPPGAHPHDGWPAAWLDKLWEVGGISALATPHRDHGVSLPTPDRDHGVSLPTPDRDHGVSPPAPDRNHGVHSRRVLVVWGSGGEDLDDATLEAAKAASPGWDWAVRGGGRPPSPDLMADLSAADVVVCHAGQGAVADVALARRPAVVLAQPRPHDEQVATARALERMSLAVTSRGWPSATEWPGLLERASELGGERWETWGASGASRAAYQLDSLADRLAHTMPENISRAAEPPMGSVVGEGVHTVGSVVGEGVHTVGSVGVEGRHTVGSVEGGVAVLTLAHGRHGHLRGQVAGLAAGVLVPDLHVVAAIDDPAVEAVVREAWASAPRQPEVVVVDVPAHPDGLPLAAARNAAAAAATARGADRLILLDVDCIPGPGTVATYARELAARHTREAAHPAVLCGDVAYLPPLDPGQRDWTAPADLARLPEVGEHRPDRVRLAPGERREEPDLRQFWSLSFALTAEDYAATGGFCEDYVGYGGEDTDFAQVVGARGGSLTWVGGATAYHQHHESHAPPLQHLEAVVRNAGVFADRWGWWPMEGWLQAFRERGLAAPDGDGRWRVTR